MEINEIREKIIQIKKLYKIPEDYFQIERQHFIYLRYERLVNQLINRIIFLEEKIKRSDVNE